MIGLDDGEVLGESDYCGVSLIWDRVWKIVCWWLWILFKVGIFWVLL